MALFCISVLTFKKFWIYEESPQNERGLSWCVRNPGWSSPTEMCPQMGEIIFLLLNCDGILKTYWAVRNINTYSPLLSWNKNLRILLSLYFWFFFYVIFTVWISLTPDFKDIGQRHDLPQRDSRENYFLKMTPRNVGSWRLRPEIRDHLLRLSLIILNFVLLAGVP